MSLLWPWGPLLVLPLLAVALLRERRLGGGPGARRARGAARVLLLLLIGLALGEPELLWRSARPAHVVLAVDRSEAADDAVRQAAQAAADEAAAAARDAGAALQRIGFTSSAGAVLPALPACSAWPGGARDAVEAPEPPRAALATAARGLEAARALLPAQAQGRVVLLLAPAADLSGLAQALAAAAEEGVRVEVRVCPERSPPAGRAPRLTDLSVPEEDLRGVFDVRVRAEGPPGLVARLWADGRPVAARPLPDDGEREALFGSVDLPPGLHVLAVEVRAGSAAPDDAPPPASRAEADVAQRSVRVEARPRIVACVSDPERSLARRAASVQGFEVEAVPPEALAERLAEGAPGAAALLLDAAAAAALTPEAAERVQVRVAQGLGLFLEAGEDPAAWARLSTSPLSGLLPLEPLPELPAAEPPAPPPPPEPPEPPEPPPEPPEPPKPAPGLAVERQPEEAFPITLLLVLDRSASMHGERWAMAVEAAVRAAAVLSPFDRLGVITFAEDARVDLRIGPADRAGSLALLLPQEAVGLGTNIVSALRLAAETLRGETLRGESSPIRHVLFLTDGQHNPSGRRAESAIWGDLVRPLNALGATLTVVGLSDEHDRRTLSEIRKWARRGEYLTASHPADVPTVLTRDTERVAAARSDEARARLPSQPPPERKPPEPLKPEPLKPGPLKPGPPKPGPTPPASPAPAPAGPREQPPPSTGPARAALEIVLPHPAVRGFAADDLPEVEAPRRSGPRAGASLVLVRAAPAGAPPAPVLAARRYRLGRVLAFALDARDRGLAAWPALGRLYGQALRSVLAPEGALEGAPVLRVLAGPDGDALRVEQAEEGARALTVRWRGPEGERALGTVETHAWAPGLELPDLPPGTPAFVEVRDAAGERLGARAYLAGAGRRPARPEETAARIKDLAPPEPPLRPPAPRPVPLRPWLLGLALLLLPVDTWLHRRRAA